MFTLYVKKDALEFEREVGNKEQFVDALGTLYDMMENEIKENNKPNEEEIRKKVYDEVWEGIFKRTNFEDQESFWEWMDLMRRKGLQTVDFNYESWVEESVDLYVRNETEYYDLQEMVDRNEELRCALEDITDIINSHM